MEMGGSVLKWKARIIQKREQDCVAGGRGLWDSDTGRGPEKGLQ